MKKIFTILFILYTLQTNAQDTLTGKCWTPEMDTTEFQNQPWFSNNDYLEHFLDSIGYPAAGSGNIIVGAPQVRFWIPIKFWVYQDDNGNGGPTITQIQTLMDDLNRRFNQTNNAWIGFYMKCDPTYINNSAHVTKTFTGASLLMAQNNDNGSINVHIIGSFNSIGTAGFSIDFLNASMIPSGAYLNSTANGDLAHEIGHVLGLQHTHQYSAWNWKCLTECVSRTRTWPTFNLCPTRVISNRVCEATGDGLRDTQADDNLINNSECFYNVNFGNDEWNDSYDNPPAGLQDRPNINNIMSYNSATNCVDQISRLQIGVMLWTLYFKKTNNLGGWANPISTFDDFEPDNTSEMTININRHISINNIQERNFHQQWNRVGGYSYTTQCDVDWVRFVAPCTNTLTVSTSAMVNRTNANTRLTIFNNTLTQLAQNDDISSGNQFSSITFNFIAGQEYFICVENMGNLITSYYNLQIAYTNPLAMNGANQFCNSSDYSIDNLPTGSTVIWSVMPSGIVNLSCTNCVQTTLSKIINGTITLTANVNSCGIAQTFTKSITVGGYSDYQVQINGYTMVPLNYTSSYSVDLNTYPGLSNLVWSAPPGWICITGCTNSNYVVMRSPSSASTGNINLSFSSCGTNGILATKWVAWGYGGPSFRISPNPANDILKIEQIDSATNKALAQTNIQMIEIIDKMGLVAYRKTFAKGIPNGITIPVGRLRNDVYTVRIFDGKEWKSYKIIVLH